MDPSFFPASGASKAKYLGQVFTPAWVVELILDKVGYAGERALAASILELGAGDGAFLAAIADRYAKAARRAGWSGRQTAAGLARGITGIEIDGELCERCRARLDAVAAGHGLPTVAWDLRHEDALRARGTRRRYDLVVGNPPYIRVHNLAQAVVRHLKANYEFCRRGMVDVYLAFFELGLGLLKEDGALCYIAPNMFLRNSSNRDFRNHLVRRNLLDDLVNFGSHMVFKGVSTYSCIAKLRKGRTAGAFAYHVYDGRRVVHANDIRLADHLDRRFVFASREEAAFVANGRAGGSCRASPRCATASRRCATASTCAMRPGPRPGNAASSTSTATPWRKPCSGTWSRARGCLTAAGSAGAGCCFPTGGRTGAGASSPRTSCGASIPRLTSTCS